VNACHVQYPSNWRGIEQFAAHAPPLFDAAEAFAALAEDVIVAAKQSRY
jgi:hypothetical protein